MNPLHIQEQAATPFDKWWISHVPTTFDDPVAKRLAREAWIAALEEARQLMRETLGEAA